MERISEYGKIQFSFKIRKVSICRPWMETNIFTYPSIAIKGKEAGSWSSGELNAKKNHGSFPLLPKEFLVAKDIQIKAQDGDKTFKDIVQSSFQDEKTEKAKANAEKPKVASYV